jgi:uncharacterized membrane protein
MPNIDLSVVMRWFHILAGMVAVGGMVFSRAVVMPSTNVLSADSFIKLKDAMRARWSKIVAAAIAVLLISGLTNFVITVKYYEVPKWYHMIFGIKFLVAFVIFFISSVLSGRSALAERFRKNAKFWLNLNIFLAVIVVCLSGLLKTAVKTPKQPVQVQAAALSPLPHSHG